MSCIATFWCLRCPSDDCQRYDSFKLRTLDRTNTKLLNDFRVMAKNRRSRLPRPVAVKSSHLLFVAAILLCVYISLVLLEYQQVHHPLRSNNMEVVIPKDLPLSMKSVIWFNPPNNSKYFMKSKRKEWSVINAQRKESKKSAVKEYKLFKSMRNDSEDTSKKLYATTSLPIMPGFVGGGDRIILLWTRLSKRKPFWNFRSYVLDRCPYRCKVTNDKRYLNQSSIVVFRLRMLKRTSRFAPTMRPYVWDLDFNSMPEQKYSGQVWVDVNEESPIYSHSDEEVAMVDKSFDYLVSYHSRSDYSLKYMIPHRKREVKLQPSNYAANKTKMALWYVSHCEALSGRDAYVKQLRDNGITIDIFGKCSGVQDGCINSTDYECIDQVRSKYKFYLAFENSICSEYITEKFWTTLNSTSYNVPIALGANVQEYKHFAPPNSFLHVKNFSSPNELAKFMIYLDKNEGAYNSYHRWRETYELYREPRESLDCWICRMAHEQPKGRYKSYSRFWSKENFCPENVDYIQQKIV